MNFDLKGRVVVYDEEANRLRPTPGYLILKTIPWVISVMELSRIMISSPFLINKYTTMLGVASFLSTITGIS